MDTEAVTETREKSERASCITFQSVKAVYKRSTQVVFKLVNNCGLDIILPNSVSWPDNRFGWGDCIFSTSFRGNHFCKTWWSNGMDLESKNNEGKPALPGLFTARLVTEMLETHFSSFRIE